MSIPVYLAGLPSPWFAWSPAGWAVPESLDPAWTGLELMKARRESVGRCTWDIELGSHIRGLGISLPAWILPGSHKTMGSWLQQELADEPHNPELPHVQ